MEDSGFCYTANEQRFLARFPCTTASSSARRTPSLKRLEPPRKTLNLSPKPVPSFATRSGRQGTVGDFQHLSELSSRPRPSIPSLQRRCSAISVQTTKNPVCGGFVSPLTDSNRRPPPTILEPSREARARPGHGGHESPVNLRDPTDRRDPRVDARGQPDVRISFAWVVGCIGNDLRPWHGRPVCLERVELILQNKKMKFEERNMKTTMLPEESDAKSPAGADIRFLMDGKTGDMIHSTVPPHQINKATVHATVSEFWYVLEGHGEIWRDDGKESNITVLVPGTSIDIPVGTAFQYRNVSNVELKFICITMPPWPGESEATYVKGIWQPTI
jgi:mannose-6-phosphate isomerase-like protein (cupin superfamily)